MTDTRRRTWAAPVSLTVLAASVMVAISGTHTWSQPSTRTAAFEALQSDQTPAVTALALLVAASWALLLVTRRRIRRILAVVAALACLGLGAVMINAMSTVPAGVRRDLAPTPVDLEWTAWMPTAWICLALLLLAVGAGVATVGRWPEMSSKYDAPTASIPGSASGSGTGLDLDSPHDVWKALDAGSDPTASR